ncbi:hypothetical protein INR49_000656 [Caranx melampygus]|nr:hypothetical protein INR49_000656 [Caranx melampygus]
MGSEHGSHYISVATCSEKISCLVPRQQLSSISSLGPDLDRTQQDAAGADPSVELQRRKQLHVARRLWIWMKEAHKLFTLLYLSHPNPDDGLIVGVNGSGSDTETLPVLRDLGVSVPPASVYRDGMSRWPSEESEPGGRRRHTTKARSDVHPHNNHCEIKLLQSPWLQSSSTNNNNNNNSNSNSPYPADTDEWHHRGE